MKIYSQCLFSLPLLKLHPCFDIQGNMSCKRVSFLEVVSSQSIMKQMLLRHEGILINILIVHLYSE